LPLERNGADEGILTAVGFPVELVRTSMTRGVLSIFMPLERTPFEVGNF
tara:strand:- start:1386 stop:1532 length:147 start_codon:yes stop_codon:yes gene_type:complete